MVKHVVAGALGDASADARMLVLGSAGSDSGVGSHVIRAINEARCPTLVWRPSAATRTGKPLPVVVGVDESDHSGRALRAAFDAATAWKAPLTVIHMWELAAAVGLGYSQGLMDWKLLHMMQADQQQQLDELIAPLTREFPHVHVQKDFQDISPAKGLRELSKTAQLVVVGRRGHGPLTGPILGSVSQSVLHHAECPVLVAP
jgi:nucleotide-binding universal stress UspA family protein